MQAASMPNAIAFIAHRSRFHLPSKPHGFVINHAILDNPVANRSLIAIIVDTNLKQSLAICRIMNQIALVVSMMSRRAFKLSFSCTTSSNGGIILVDDDNHLLICLLIGTLRKSHQTFFGGKSR